MIGTCFTTATAGASSPWSPRRRRRRSPCSSEASGRRRRRRGWNGRHPWKPQSQRMSELFLASQLAVQNHHLLRYPNPSAVTFTLDQYSRQLRTNPDIQDQQALLGRQPCDRPALAGGHHSATLAPWLQPAHQTLGIRTARGMGWG